MAIFQQMMTNKPQFYLKNHRKDYCAIFNRDFCEHPDIL